MQTAHPDSTDLVPSQGKAAAPSLVVSLHDVSTVTRTRSVTILRDLADEGVPVTSLLVIPDHHGRGRIDRDPVFREWLSEAVARGHEAVLHGYHHLRRPRPGEGIANRIITRHYTAGEGEFHDPDFEDARLLIRMGREALGLCGVSFTGFIAPAWLLGAEAERALREEGFSYTTRIGRVIDLENRMAFPSRSMVYSVRAAWRRTLSLAWNEWLFQCMSQAPLLRVGLHPPDWDHAPIRRQILRCIRSSAKTRRVTTYGEWLDRWRASGHEGGIR